VLNGIFDPFGFLSPRRSKAFLTDRTNGRAYATILRPSSSSLRNVLWLNGASWNKSSRIWEIDWYQIDLCL